MPIARRSFRARTQLEPALQLDARSLEVALGEVEVGPADVRAGESPRRAHLAADLLALVEELARPDVVAAHAGKPGLVHEDVRDGHARRELEERLERVLEQHAAGRAGPGFRPTAARRC